MQALQDYVDMVFMERDIADVALSGLSSAYLGFQKPGHALELMAQASTNTHSTSYVDFGEREPGERGVTTVGSPVAMCDSTYQSLARDRNHAFHVSVVVDNEGLPRNISIDGDGPVRLKRYLKTSLKSGRYRPAMTAEGEFTTSTLSFRQTFGEAETKAGSLSDVADWSRMLVAQTCQTTGIQRI
jgi:hypothetical protein